ncbi:MAG: preprotein translocase subunit SecY [Acidiferrobacter sp.]
MAAKDAKRQGSLTPGMLGRLSDLKQRIFFLLGALVVFRIGTHIPVPGINGAALASLFQRESGSIIGMFNMFSGGALQRLSVFALGIMPYISASIVIQLLTPVIPKLDELRKDGGEAGRRKLTQYTRYGTSVLAAFQGLGISIALEHQTAGGVAIVRDPGLGFELFTMVTLVAGTMFLMWLGEQITERGIGNGISMIIFAGIVAGLPQAIGGTLELASNGSFQPLFVLLLFGVALAVTAFVVFVERGQRRITVTYAKRQQGRKIFGGQTTHLPLKVNTAGVIPPIFASSMILFPTMAANWFGHAKGMGWLQNVANALAPGQPVYLIVFSVAVMFFSFFYTAMIMDPKDTAENLKKSGAFIPGIRPGEQTRRYIDDVMSRLTLSGGIYITLVSLLPEFLILKWNVPFYFGGTSLLIIVVVSMDFMAQVQAHLMSHQYESLLKKANLTGGVSGLPK